LSIAAADCWLSMTGWNKIFFTGTGIALHPNGVAYHMTYRFKDKLIHRITRLSPITPSHQLPASHQFPPLTNYPLSPITRLSSITPLTNYPLTNYPRSPITPLSPTRRETRPSATLSSANPHTLTWYWAQASTDKSRWLTIRTMTRPDVLRCLFYCYLCGNPISIGTARFFFRCRKESSV
jgi:hypothetical protein